MGNLLTKLDVERIGLKSHGISTLGGRKVWFDHDIQRLNYDDHGQYLGEFHAEEAILVILKNGEFYTTNFDLNNHYEQNILRIEKYDPQKVWTAALFDADQGYPYLKRFTLEATARHQNFIGDNAESYLILLTDTVYPRLLVTYAAPDDFREPMEIDAEQFIGQKSFKAKGKRITTLALATIEELEPTRMPEAAESPDGSENDGDEDSEASNDEGESTIEPEDKKPEAPDEPPTPAREGHIDPLTGQFNLFDE
jgi:topoisomerase-4 subunit A